MWISDLRSFIATSDGEHIPAPNHHLRASERRLAKAQRAHSRKRKGSKRREKSKTRVAKIHAKIRNQRKDFLHNTSRRLVDAHGRIAVEKLTTRNMLKNHHLAKSISDAGWSKFVQMLLYKAESAGKEIALVNPKNTSQDCSGCGGKVEKTLATRTHRCPDCGLILDRDVNAARNILKRAELKGAVLALRGGD